MVKVQRSDRRECGVKAWRKRWYGWYYLPDGTRKNNVPLYMAVDHKPVPVPIPCTRDEPKDCPYRDKALEEIRRIATAPVHAAALTPPLSQLIDTYEKTLLSAGNSARCTAYRAQVLRCTIDGVRQNGYRNRGKSRGVALKGIGWKELREVNRREFIQFMDKLAEIGRAPQTINEYLSNWSCFAVWCIDREFMKENPFANISRRKGGHNRYIRRAFTKEEFRRIIDNTIAGEQLFYLCKGLSGFRIDEMRKLRKYHAQPIGEVPHWTLTPEIQKVKEHETLPMVPALAKALAQRWYNIGDNDLLFPDAPSRTDFYKLLSRLEIPRKDDRGQWVSFHSFRYFFCTQMAAIHPMRDVQLLMRHKSITLTMKRYRKLNLRDIGQNWQIPDIPF